MILELEAFYSRLNFKLVSKTRFSPHITCFTEEKTGKFSYEQYADPDPNGSRAVFIPNTRDGQKIVVKFMETYETAHSLLATKGLAPQLLSCDQSTFSDFAMVAMLFHKYFCATPRKVLDEVSRALSTLHDNGLVFSDLRSPNILITNQHCVRFMDLDWRGKVREGEYPRCRHQTAGGHRSR